MNNKTEIPYPFSYWVDGMFNLSDVSLDIEETEEQKKYRQACEDFEKELIPIVRNNKRLFCYDPSGDYREGFKDLINLNLELLDKGIDIPIKKVARILYVRKFGWLKGIYNYILDEIHTRSRP